MSIDKVSNPIEMHHFSHPLYKARKGKYDTLILELPITHNIAKLHKHDVIAMAKHFKLTAHDIDCQEFKALQKYSDSADEESFDREAKIQSNVNSKNKSVN
ncbi:MAG: hypothetical protein V3R25_06105 [Nitrosomonadaceae bacterium]